MLSSKSSQPPDAQLEVENFLQAIRSYPDRFARDPQVSFEQHLGSIMASQTTALHQH